MTENIDLVLDSFVLLDDKENSINDERCSPVINHSNQTKDSIEYDFGSIIPRPFNDHEIDNYYGSSNSSSTCSIEKIEFDPDDHNCDANINYSSISGPNHLINDEEASPDLSHIPMNYHEYSTNTDVYGELQSIGIKSEYAERTTMDNNFTRILPTVETIEKTNIDETQMKGNAVGKSDGSDVETNISEDLQRKDKSAFRISIIENNADKAVEQNKDNAEVLSIMGYNVTSCLKHMEGGDNAVFYPIIKYSDDVPLVISKVEGGTADNLKNHLANGINDEDETTENQSDDADFRVHDIASIEIEQKTDRREFSTIAVKDMDEGVKRVLLPIVTYDSTSGDVKYLEDVGNTDIDATEKRSEDFPAVISHGESGANEYEKKIVLTDSRVNNIEIGVEDIIADNGLHNDDAQLTMTTSIIEADDVSLAIILGAQMLKDAATDGDSDDQSIHSLTPIGIKNPSNFKCSNAVLVMLFNCPHFRKSLIDYHHKGYIAQIDFGLHDDVTVNDACFVNELCRLFSVLAEGNVNGTKVKIAARSVRQYFKSRLDLHQGFLYILNKTSAVTRIVYNKPMRSTNKDDIPFIRCISQNDGFVNQLFSGETLKKVFCENCLKTNCEEYEQTKSLFLTIPKEHGTITLESCIKSYFSESTPPINYIYHQCCTNPNLKMRRTITHAPQYLFILLDRRLENGSRNHTYVETDNGIIVPTNNGMELYSLCSVIDFVDIQSHFYYVLKCFSDTWWLIEDKRARPIQNFEVVGEYSVGFMLKRQIDN